MAAKHRIAVLGAGGTMGFPIARNLARAGFAVRAWNRSREKAEPLKEDGANVFDTPAEAAESADVILTMLANADVVRQTLGEALAELEASGMIWLQMSTIGESGVESCIELAKQHQLSFVDAPVLGTREPAERRELVIMASGPSELQPRLQPIFEAIGKRVMWLGEAGRGTRLKVATNTWILAIVEGAAETLALAEGLGLDAELVLEAVKGGPLDLPYLQMKGNAIINRDFAPSFKAELAAKDASLAVESAARRDMELPLVQTIRERLQEAAEEHGEKDMIATYLLSAPARADA